MEKASKGIDIEFVMTFLDMVTVFDNWSTVFSLASKPASDDISILTVPSKEEATKWIRFLLYYLFICFLIVGFITPPLRSFFWIIFLYYISHMVIILRMNNDSIGGRLSLHRRWWSYLSWIMEKPKELSSIDRKVYKKWLSIGDFSSIHTTFGENQYKKALLYIAKNFASYYLMWNRSSEWMHLLEVGFPIPSKATTPDPQLTPVVIQTPGKRRATAPLQHHPEGKKPKKKHNDRKCKKVKTSFPILIEPTFDNPIPLYPRRRV